MDVAYHRRALVGADAAEVDAFLARARGAHYMQAPAWDAVATADLTWQRRWLLFRERGRLVSTALMLRPRRGRWPLPRAIIERGPVVDDPRDLARVLPALTRAVRWHGIDALRVQPYWDGAEARVVVDTAASAGYHTRGEVDGPHTTTVRLPLEGADPEVLAGPGRAEVRRDLRRARELGVTVRRGTAPDLATMARLYAALMTSQGEPVDRSPAYFAAFSPLLAREQAALFVAEFEGEVEAIVLVCAHPGQVTFHLGAGRPERRKFRKMVAPLAEAAAWARARGAVRFDLGGVPAPTDTDAKRRAIATFKLDFARDLVDLTPALYAPHTAWGVALRGAITAWRRARR